MYFFYLDTFLKEAYCIVAYVRMECMTGLRSGLITVPS